MHGEPPVHFRTRVTRADWPRRGGRCDETRELVGLLGVVVVMAAVRADAAEVGAPDAHVRAANAEARELLVRAAAQAPTVAKLVAELEAADVVVVIELKPPAEAEGRRERPRAGGGRRRPRCATSGSR